MEVEVPSPDKIKQELSVKLKCNEDVA